MNLIGLVRRGERMTWCEPNRMPALRGGSCKSSQTTQNDWSCKWVKMTILAILTNVVYDQLMTNMVNMGDHQKHREKLVHWSTLELI